MKEKKFFCGIDIGSVSINVTILDEAEEVIKNWYIRIEGKPLEKTYHILKEITEKYTPLYLIATGSGGKLISKILGIPFINEILAQTKAVGKFYPEVKTIIDIGGEESKFISIKYDKSLNSHIVIDFAMNTICAAGTGSFLDQQAGRLGLSIEEFSLLGVKTPTPPRIAGRCSVFANSDMIHLQQEATPVQDIVAGLCFALARNFKSVIAKGKRFLTPVCFQGGVAYNESMRRAFKETLQLKAEEFIIPRYVASMGAIGGALKLKEEGGEEFEGKRIENIKEFIQKREEKYKPLPKLKPLPPSEKLNPISIRKHKTKIPAWLGIDIGSISTNLVLIDEDKKVISYRYLWTAGRPIDKVREGLREIGKEIGEYVEIRGVGVTGSGRYMIGNFVGADVIKNEITAQARATVEIDSKVDTIFEIGGQDSKYISIHNGVIVDFEMNKVCAAGTGSFLEEQAEKLDLSVKNEFAFSAFKGGAPVNLGERCTVFMQSNLTSWQQKGVQRENLAAGLAYSIVHNYLNRVVGRKKIGDRIYFQGAVAHNKAIVSAFQEVLKKEIRVPPYNDITGAIGVAILAKEEGNGGTNFKGFNLYKREYKVDRFECKGCANSCEIKKLLIENESPFYYGSRCEKYEKEEEKKKKEKGVNWFEVRGKFLLESYEKNKKIKKGPKVGIPRVVLFHEYLPFWVTFLTEIGCKVVLSPTTNKKIIHKGVEITKSDHCFPIKICHGHIVALVEEGVDYILFPSLITMPKEYDGVRNSYACPFLQAVPYVIKAAVELGKTKMIIPTLYLSRRESYLRQALFFVAKELGIENSKVLPAFRKAKKAQKEFYTKIKEKGDEVLGSLKDKAIVIVGRPYNTCDLGLNLDIPRIIAKLGLTVLPMDFLRIEEMDLKEDWENMFWRYGQRILGTAKKIKYHPQLYPIYITNFGCGPDSFVQRFFEFEYNGPHLVIEVDEHSAPAGVITRCEAFLDSIKNVTPQKTKTKPQIKMISNYKNRTLYIPFMGYQSYALASVFKYYGISAKVIPLATEESVELGRKYTTGKECFPCIITTGDMLRLLFSKEIDPKSVAFFMPESGGPCRFGQYNKLQRIILKELGFENVPIVSPNQAKGFFYETLREYGEEFDKRGWLAMCMVDTLDKLVRHTRPYEINKGEADLVYDECLTLLCKAIEEERVLHKISNLMKLFTRKFTSIPVKRTPKPLVGVTGEIYVRQHHFSNNNIVKTLESLGAEVEVATTAEWFFYVNRRQKEDSVADRDWRSFFKVCVKNWWQRKCEHKVIMNAKEGIPHAEEPTIEELFEYSNPYLYQAVEGEAVLTIGKCIDFIKKGVDGLVTVMPFTCMPGTNVSAIMHKVKEEYNIPYINMSYDGLEQATASTRLEAFMGQVHQHMKKKKE